MAGLLLEGFLVALDEQHDRPGLWVLRVVVEMAKRSLVIDQGEIAHRSFALTVCVYVRVRAKRGSARRAERERSNDDPCPKTSLPHTIATLSPVPVLLSKRLSAGKFRHCRTKKFHDQNRTKAKRHRKSNTG